MKRGIILKHGGGELANQLWNYISVYAFGLQTGARIENPSFFEYHRHFNLWKQEGLLTRFLSFWFQGPIRRRGHPLNKAWRRAYALYAYMVKHLYAGSVCSSENQESTVTYLPPTAELSLPETDTAYFEGWLFRNPAGMEKYGAELRAAFAPSAQAQNDVDRVTASLRESGGHVLGIHLRQGDYRIFKDGKYLITPERMREIIDEYVREKSISPEHAVLFIASDGPVPAEAFKGYRIHISKEQAVTDLFILSKADAIIGSDSSFGHFASWYGNIPHIVATDTPLDWEYYRGKEGYFPNKYCTLARL